MDIYKKAECQRIGAFELWCWRRLLRVPWTPRRSNQSILKEISPGCPLEGLMLKLIFQYFGHLMGKTDSFEKTLMLGKIEGRRRRGRQRMRWLDGITDSMDMGLVDSGSWWWTGGPGVLQFMGSQRIGHDWATEPSWMKKVHVQTNGSTCIISLNSYVTPHEGGPFYKWGNRFNTCQCFHIPSVMVALLRFMLCFLVPLKMKLILALQTWSGQHWGPPAP